MPGLMTCPKCGCELPESLRDQHYCALARQWNEPEYLAANLAKLARKR